MIPNLVLSHRRSISRVKCLASWGGQARHAQKTWLSGSTPEGFLLGKSGSMLGLSIIGER